MKVEEKLDGVGAGQHCSGRLIKKIASWLLAFFSTGVTAAEREISFFQRVHRIEKRSTAQVQLKNSNQLSDDRSRLVTAQSPGRRSADPNSTAGICIIVT